MKEYSKAKRYFIISILISLIIPIIIIIALNFVDRPSKEEIEETAKFADSLVGSIQYAVNPEFEDQNKDYTINISLNEKEGKSKVYVKIDDVLVTYPAKIVNDTLKIGIDYRIVQVQKFRLDEIIVLFLLGFCLFLLITEITFAIFVERD